MKISKVGALEAKTHLSRLLDEVENGAVVRIMRRGKLVVVMKSDESVSRANALDTPAAVRELCRRKVAPGVVEDLRDEGREQ